MSKYLKVTDFLSKFEYLNHQSKQLFSPLIMNSIKCIIIWNSIRMSAGPAVLRVDWSRAAACQLSIWLQVGQLQATKIQPKTGPCFVWT